ncbi:opioid growth factor receptor-like protein 1 [Silurus meridionalis]|uniref:Opioid growth factor receptor (OGFr) conserved domain-containing protein n=1 Tax=Silurus meridionalis TaxID=175797 RepID=A0A8T0AKV8_SILME|nr:opioid growth factor receptor-like protein 1 [Silurus meridionalis]KAF7693385.1 hypothetical protein HF521_008701 [Silurus meridionalis]
MGNSENTFKNYDSTWEDEDYEDTTESFMLWGEDSRDTHAAEDMHKYRCTYRLIHSSDMREHTDSPQDENSPNLWFYQNKIPMNFDGMSIEEFHMYWFGDYDKLEHVHSYIQWLFPLDETGMNSPYKLSTRAIRMFRRDEAAKKRLLTSYRLMLDFYGTQLVDEKTGEVQRAVNWEERFANLNRNAHNNLRITRILKCLGLLGFRHYQAPLVHFFLVETLVKGTLPQIKQSVLDYFMFAVVDRLERKQLIKFALCYFEPKEKFVWCPSGVRIKFLKELKRAQTDQ